MFPEVGGLEYIVVAIVALLVVKPKDLPVMMRKFGEIMGKARRMANDFRASFEDMARQSELDDLRKEVEAMRAKASDPMGLTTAMRETTDQIQASIEPTASHDFDYNFSGDEADTSVAWEGSGATSEPVQTPAAEAAPAAPKKRKAAPKTASAKGKPGKKADAKVASPARPRSKASSKLVN